MFHCHSWNKLGQKWNNLRNLKLFSFFFFFWYLHLGSLLLPSICFIYMYFMWIIYTVGSFGCPSSTLERRELISPQDLKLAQHVGYGNELHSCTCLRNFFRFNSELKALCHYYSWVSSVTKFEVCGYWHVKIKLFFLIKRSKSNLIYNIRKLHASIRCVP